MSTKTNDQIILENLIKSKSAEAEGQMSPSEYFELYSAEQVLKSHDLSYDDILYGIIGDGGDGGIDSLYTFVNGEPLKEDTEINASQKNNHIELVIIQSKTSPSFKEDAVIKFRETAQDLFNLANDIDTYVDRYNSSLIDRIKLFRAVYSKLSITFPKMEVRFYYVTQGTEVHPNVSNKTLKLRDDITKMFSGAEFDFQFITAAKLLEMTRDTPSTSRALEVSESPIGTNSGSYLCLVDLPSYFNFVSDSGSLSRSIFESNVRDYQGNVTVNTGIKKTLENRDSDNFWYLNNGVTIITPKAVLAGKELTIEDPQIVNGLQTSYEIYQYFSQIKDPQIDNRAVLVRVICERDEEARDRIIRATNNQTAIPPASLRSSDDIHRNIEDFLRSNNFYYDRKKNYYKNQGKPVQRIVSISYMAQAVMAIVLLKPDSARARPSTLIKSDTEYKKIFSLDYPIDIYLKVILIMKEVELFLKPENCAVQLERKVIANIKFYVATLVSQKILGNTKNIEVNLSRLTAITPSKEQLKESLNEVLTKFNELGGTDQVAKGPSLRKSLLENL